MSAPPDHRQPSADCAYVFDLAAPYALGALEADERHEVNNHTDGCSDCTGLLAQSQRTVSLLPFLAPPATPSPDVKLSLFARIEQASQASQARVEPFQSTVTARPFVPTPTIPSSKPVPVTPEADSGSGGRWQLPWSGRRGSGRSRFPSWQMLATPLATVPLVLALAIVGGWAVSAQSRLNDRDATVQTLNMDLTSARSEMERLRSEIDNYGSLMSDDTVAYESAQQGSNAASGLGKLYVTQQEAEAMLIVSQLSAAGNGSDYEVYLEDKNGHMEHAGEFQVDENGNATVEIDLDHPLQWYEAIHVKPTTSSRSDGITTDVTLSDGLVVVIDSNVGEPDDTGSISQRG